MVRVIVVSFFFVCSSAFTLAYATDEDDLGLGEGAEGFEMKIDKAQVTQMLELMQSQGQISAEDAAKAKQELNQKSDADMEKLQKNAMDSINSGNIPKLPPPVSETTRAPASVPSATNPTVPVAAAVASPIAPATTTASPLAPKPADDRTKKLQDALQFINK
ncbi:MAG: hypothetical protein A2X86_01655 [Bdellovibrionales bacterium GWA2_49_15]|nr:MAG: hypothetical protein A2X86_01655 [Bdellovibrionales bacterium GWA2_49_15]